MEVVWARGYPNTVGRVHNVFDQFSLAILIARQNGALAQCAGGGYNPLGQLAREAVNKYGVST